MNQRKLLIDMISNKEKQRYHYSVVVVLSDDPPETWEEYDKEADQYIEFDAYDDEVYLLTPEQAKQLGDVRNFEILALPNYYVKLVQMGLETCVVKNITSKRL